MKSERFNSMQIILSLFLVSVGAIILAILFGLNSVEPNLLNIFMMILAVSTIFIGSLLLGVILGVVFEKV